MGYAAFKRLHAYGQPCGWRARKSRLCKHLVRVPLDSLPITYDTSQYVVVKEP